MRRASFRCDAGAAIGAGHLMRCLTLAQALKDRGWQAQFHCRDLPGAGLDRIAEAGFAFHLHAADDAGEVRTALSDGPPGWLIVDHYGLDAEFERAACPPGWRVMVIDDLADRTHDCALLLDQTPGRAASDYDGRVGEDCRRLIGPDYALIRPEFAAARRERKPGPLARLLLAPGGTDPVNMAGAVLEALAGRSDLHITVVLGAGAPHVEAVSRLLVQRGDRGRLITDSRDMAGLMASHDLAIGAGGMSALERAVMGLPSLIITLADNQFLAARTLDEAGAAVLIGDARAPGWTAALAPALEALADPERRVKMARAGLALVDGQGAGRVAEALDAQ
ncbi:UDP-2,4-diacetamido-2,4,6-trideoxy-beta-L-altropyranose hydrolase [Alkalicaulis satelles]|uniref:UDP-2,4-diacetamido-2,4, 6-trideoxy-beta-L-altropyranose hydrolase n=1 Tax=Alkalicaulis satelles TaxID=2609175 RepID=A0A5M6ZCB2_9PROT|nr:UDP-2,4-diacetamido-2,4,6-trideoxy-beta-L-altropyranose hydrolase [Alkalicaulis satelles]KAA5802373.1 UDP-2,4-diacetamido-2,4,6-trideoxy-beta-L-altropyranose hydrolase [Alkalicaulis satelles]